MPAYNAALTLEKTYNEINTDIVDDVVMVVVVPVVAIAVVPH